MSAAVKLSKPRIRIVIGDIDDETRRAEFTVQTIQKDQVMAETELATSKRGRPQEHPILMTSATAYFALRRTGKLTGQTFTQFEEGCIDVEVLDDDTPATPTPEEASTA